ncbi:MAG: fluoride efflux transporter CrcB [Rhodobacteraceae bacterium]|nr:fluoride efflux transporter CrcB [Paracoccaceae bacterium]MAY44272.1 fluoride efflux transporter CrcB [Paracoccaceae bacterium]QEW22113.1 camphor resistance protein CrcB [Marinibacterium anthonyi]
MIFTMLQVALGGAIGATGRYLTGVAVFKMLGPQAFPLGVISVNIVGSAIMGMFAELAAARGLSHLGPFVMTGMLGGFTTFSAFSLETVSLMERGDFGLAALYVMLSVVCSVGALYLAMQATRGVFL